MTPEYASKPMGPERESAEYRAKLMRWFEEQPPADAQEAWFISQVVLHEIRLERCRVQEAAIRIHEAARAGACWDDDRRLDAEILAEQLSAHPAVIARKLRQYKQGAELLIERWRSLGATLDASGTWTDAQRSLALDLLGVPAELREGPNPADPASIDEADRLAQRKVLVLIEIQTLDRMLEDYLNRLDANQRSSAQQGIGGAASSEHAQNLRLEAQFFKRYRWAFDQLIKYRKSLPPRAPSRFHEHERPPVPEVKFAPPPPPPTRPAPTASTAVPCDSSPVSVSPAPSAAPFQAHATPAPGLKVTFKPAGIHDRPPQGTPRT